MAYKLEVGIPDTDGRIRIMHTFYGETEEECEKLRDGHADICPNFGPHLKSGDVTEEIEEIDDDEWPSTDDEEED